ncbi:MAG: xylose isomerase [Herbinix sp.]|jgi:sugar phosphate isomerase/epimerase|nr:xylose isomerase [Herbinix sp.]
MKLGMPTLIETKDIAECVLLCKELELDFIELNMNFPQYQIDRIDMPYYLELAENNHIFYTIHLEEELNVCGYNKEVTKAYIRTVEAVIEIARQLKAPVINMHMAEGIYITLPDKKVYLFEQYKSIYLERLREFRKVCELAIEDSDIKICIENSGGYKDYLKEGIELLLESRVFALTFDIGHDHCIGGMDEPFIRKHKDRLMHMHLHDAIGKKNHLAIGTGDIDISDKLALARECNCRGVLETKTIAGLKKTVVNLKNF